jgi:hypothetical protein
VIDSKQLNAATSWDEFPILMDANDVQRVLRLSKPKIYQIMNRSDFPIIELGKKKFTNKDYFQSWLGSITCPAKAGELFE